MSIFFNKKQYYPSCLISNTINPMLRKLSIVKENSQSMVIYICLNYLRFSIFNKPEVKLLQQVSGI